MPEITDATRKPTPDQRSKWWGEERNERRRQRYRADVEYRKKVREQTRTSYRKRQHAAGARVRNDDCSQNITRLGEFGAVRPVLCEKGLAKPTLTLTVTEMSQAMNRNPQMLYRWLADNMFPRPSALVVNDYKRKQAVYTEVEAKAAIREFARHQRHSQYYRQHHVETRDRIFAAIFSARATLAHDGILV